MKQKSELFELIKSLDKNEKRYFRMRASLQKGNKNYLMLFNEIERMKNYDEEKLTIKLKKEKFSRHFSFTKHYLYKLIIDCLIEYNKDKSADSKIHSLISECKILFDKTLYRQYFKKINKAKTIALKYERFGYLIQILDMEKIIIRKEELGDVKLLEIHNEVLSVLEKIKNMFAYSKFAGLLLHHYRTYGIIRNPKQDEFIDDILKTKEMQSVDNALSDKAKESYYRVHEIINGIKADYEKVFESLQMRFAVADANPYPFENSIIDVKADTLTYLMYNSLKLNKISEAEKYLTIYEDLPHNRKADKIDYEIDSSLIKFQLLLKKNEVNTAVKLIPKLEELLIKYKNKMLIDKELSIMFFIVKCLMIKKDFKGALKNINKLLNHPLLEIRRDYESILYVMNIIIHYELKNFSLLPYLIKSTYRYLYKKEKLYRLETLILDFIRKLPEVKNDDDFMFKLIQFRKKLNELKKDAYERNAFEYFDFEEWIESKIK